jgi:hypothetical protein
LTKVPIELRSVHLLRYLLVNYEIERLDKMTVLQDFDMRRDSRSGALHEHIPDALPCTYSLPSLELLEWRTRYMMQVELIQE